VGWDGIKPPLSSSESYNQSRIWGQALHQFFTALDMCLAFLSGLTLRTVNPDEANRPLVPNRVGQQLSGCRCDGSSIGGCLTTHLFTSGPEISGILPLIQRRTSDKTSASSIFSDFTELGGVHSSVKCLTRAAAVEQLSSLNPPSASMWSLGEIRIHSFKYLARGHPTSIPPKSLHKSRSVNHSY